MVPGLREVFGKRVSVAPSLITHVRCGDYGEIRSGGGHRATPALARPPDEECFVYVESGRRFHFIRFGERWTYVPRGVVL